MAGWKRGNGDSREWDKEEFSGMKKNVRRGRGQRGDIGEWLRRRKEGGGCEKKCNARTCRPITCHFYRRIHSFPLLEFILRSTIAIYGAREVNHRCLGYKVAFSFATATRESINEIEEEREWKTSNGKWKSSPFLFFFSSRMNQTIERMGLSRSILRFYLRIIRSWRKSVFVSRRNKMFEGNVFPLLRIYMYIDGIF